jgi:hypothetical protein
MESKMDTDTPFVMPDEDEDEAVLIAALVRLNAVPMTIEQMEEGADVYSKAGHDIGALQAWCENEGLLPADVAAHALIARYAPIFEAFGGDFDMKLEDPEGYQQCVTEPIDPMYLGWHLGEEAERAVLAI